MAENLSNKSRDELDALAIELGVDEADVKAAKTKNDVLALIDPDQYGSDADNSDVASDNTKDAPGVFIVNGQRVDFDGKPVKG